jgi:hypothetical protein
MELCGLMRHRAVRMVSGLLCVVVRCGAQPARVCGQSQVVARASIATRVALATIVRELASDVAEQVGQADAAAWRFDLPFDTIGVDWPLVRAELVRVLRARSPRYTDPSWSALSIADVRVTPDSVAFTFLLGGTIRCGHDFVGSSTTYAVSLARATRRWQPRATPIIFSDGVACEVPSPPDGVWRPPPLPSVPPAVPQVRPAARVPVAREHAREP